tara:strand:+ start:7683 stop:8213 length:531 start_codon:yes stop_codon:yes gene_type:complete
MIERKGRNRFAKLGKKGSLQDIMLVIGIILFFAVVVLFGFKVSSAYNDQIQIMDDIPDDAKAASETLTGHYSGVVDNMFLVLTVGLAIATLIMAALVRIHPIFIPLFFIALMLTVFLAGVASDIYQGIAANTNLASLAEELVFISTVLEFLPIFIGVFGLILMVVMYKLWSVGEFQ